MDGKTEKCVIEQLFSDHKNKIEKKDITNKKIMKP